MNRTKIIATAGPSSESEKSISGLIDAGVNVFRLNLKHSTPEWHSMMIRRIRKAASGKKSDIGVLLDLQGPEVRIGAFRNGSIMLETGQKALFTDMGGQGDERRIVMQNPHVLHTLRPGHRFSIDDGNLEFRVISSGRHELTARVLRGGRLSSNKSMNFPDTVLKIPVLSKKDRGYISMGIREKVDFFALSFVRNSRDIADLRAILRQRNSSAQVIAKVERPQALENFDSILAASDGIMIGRGDLGVEIPLPLVPMVQKEIIRKCREAGKPVITATQMLESMISSPRPTRAEVSDVANAILDGTDAIMLSAESASGSFPVESVKMMAEIDRAIQGRGLKSMRLLHHRPGTVTEAISQAVDTLSHSQLDFRAIILLTETGRTARAVAKFRPLQPVYAVTREPSVARQLSLSWGVNPRLIKFSDESRESIFSRIISGLKRANLVSPGSRVICVSGQIIGKENMTNTININKIK